MENNKVITVMENMHNTVYNHQSKSGMSIIMYHEYVATRLLSVIYTLCWKTNIVDSFKNCQQRESLIKALMTKYNMKVKTNVEL